MRILLWVKQYESDVIPQLPHLYMSEKLQYEP